MLRVRIDSREVEVMPAALAQMMLDGRVSRHHLAKASDGAAERPLEYALDPPHGEALATELLRRLRSLYASDLTSGDIDQLRVRVEMLCQWHWKEPQVRARLLWVAGWLNELTDRLDAAVGYYEAFLRVRCPDAHLRLLAYNNRGVLRLRLGRSEGVPDLARAAIVTEAGGLGAKETAGLPVACFNLLNLINAAMQNASLREAVDEELVGFFAQLPEELTGWWLGSVGTAGDSVGNAISTPGQGEAGTRSQSILGDGDYRRLNRLTTNLATRAMRMVDGRTAEPFADVQPDASRLCLWAGDVEGAAAPEGPAAQAEKGTEDRCDRYAEAASLLLADEVPSTLVADKGPGRRVEQLAQEELAQIEDLIADGQHELARSRLEVQRRVLTALNQRQQLSNLIAQVNAQLHRIDCEKQELEQLKLQRTCGHLVAEAEQFCKLASLSQAERRIGPLKQKLQSPPARTSDEVGRLLDELVQRIDRHLVTLRGAEVNRRVQLPLQRLRESWPADWAVPVPEAAYAALAECHVNDPEGQVEDWGAMKDQLDTHQAQYCLRKALAELPTERISWEEIETVLTDALSLAPDLWLTAAPLFGLAVSRNGQVATEAKVDVRTALESAAGRLWHDLHTASDLSAESPRHRLFQRANVLLDRTFAMLRSDGRRFVHLWGCLERTLQTALAAGSEEVVADVVALAQTCLRQWPAGRTPLPGRADPRNPVRVFLESCEKVRCLAQAERLLGEQPSASQEAGKLIASALRLGLETPEQFKRATACLYLIEYAQEDTAPMQRQVLARLDEWVEGLTIDTKQFTGQEDIKKALVAIRADVLVTPSTSDAADRTEATDRPDV